MNAGTAPGRTPAQQQELALLVLIGSALALAAIAAIVPWVLAVAAAWLHSGRIAPLSLGDALHAAASGELSSSDPAAAYPGNTARLLPGAWGYWSTAALLVVTLAATVLAVAREIDARMGRTIADHRWWQLFLGRRPRPFGRYQTVKALVVDAPRADRVIVGTIAKPAALIAVEDQVQICAIAAPRSGKTSGLVAPAVLEHPGPVVTTSTKTDVVAATLGRRGKVGEALVWDPFGPETCSWDLLQGCEDWGHALLVARWLVAAMQLGTSSSSQYFDAAAQELAAPLLHAAALGTQHTMLDVYRWVRDTKLDIPKRVLKMVGNDDALARLDSVYALNARQRDGITGTLQVQLTAYGHPAAARTAVRGAAGITPDRLFDGAANTVYLVAGREHQRMLAPLVITMLCSLLYAASERENRTGLPLRPQALFALDETAQIAPLQDLPQILSVSLSSGIRFLTVWHSLAQIRERYGTDAAATILALSQAKVFLGSITDDVTRQELVHLLGQQPTERDGHTQWRDTLTAQALQRLQDGQGLLVHGELPPVFFTQRRWYADPALLRLQRQ
jgi:type IV secretory pathway TraG/TraD family ATPase VirD4